MKFIYNKNDYRQSVGKKFSVDGVQQYQVFATLFPGSCNFKFYHDILHGESLILIRFL